MRAILGGLAALAISTNAWSADMLRGSAPAFGEARSYNWAGIYFGGQVGYAKSDFGFGDTVQPLIANFLRETIIESEYQISRLAALPNRSTSGSSFGGFVGWNSQWGDIVLGTELNYNHVNTDPAVSSDFIGRVVTLSTGDVREVRLTSSASANLTDYGTLRFRAGYALDWLMPYAMVGVAAGSADVTRSVNLRQRDVTNPAAPFDLIPLDLVETKSGIISVGYMLGAGVDIGLMPGVFVRAEYEFVQFANFSGVSAQTQTGRIAAAVKF